MAKGAPIYKLALPEQPLRASASVLIVRWNEMLAWSQRIDDPACVVDLHNMRIAAKRLRYTLEIFVPTLPESDFVLRAVEEIQERIGKIHDCDVLFPLLRDAIDSETKRERKATGHRPAGPPPFLAAEGLLGLMARKRDERSALYEDFIHWWNALPPTEIGDSLERLIHAVPSKGTKKDTTNK